MPHLERAPHAGQAFILSFLLLAAVFAGVMFSNSVSAVPGSPVSGQPISPSVGVWRIPHYPVSWNEAGLSNGTTWFVNLTPYGWTAPPITLKTTNSSLTYWASKLFLGYSYSIQSHGYSKKQIVPSHGLFSKAKTINVTFV